MTPLLLILALAAAPTETKSKPQPSPDQSDLAGDSLEALALRADLATPDGPPLLCATDLRWCAEIRRDVVRQTSELRVCDGPPSGKAVARHILTQADDEHLTLWPHLIRLADRDGGLFVGVERQTRTSYSGGGGSASTLELLRVSSAGPSTLHTVLALPIADSLMIRACFNEEDQDRRRRACHDEYSFGAELWLNPATTSGPPQLIVQTKATAFPAGATRQGDATLSGRLRERDLVVTTDPTCTYRRIMMLDPTVDAYAPDTPMPACDDYTVP